MATLRKVEQGRLAREDWVSAAIELLIEEGVEAVQITDLARRLNITRGSFYWHFEGRDSLLQALAAEWQNRNSGVMLSVLKPVRTLDEGILAIVQLWEGTSGFDPGLDRAVREWARQSDWLAPLVRTEDDGRIEDIATFLKKWGFPATEADVRARILYFTQVGQDMLGASPDMAMDVDRVNAWFKCIAGRRPSSAVAKALVESHGRPGK